MTSAVDSAPRGEQPPTYGHNEASPGRRTGLFQAVPTPGGRPVRIAERGWCWIPQTRYIYVRRSRRVGGAGLPQIHRFARELGWLVASAVAYAMSSGLAKDRPARAALRKTRHQPSRSRPGRILKPVAIAFMASRWTSHGKPRSASTFPRVSRRSRHARCRCRCLPGTSAFGRPPNGAQGPRHAYRSGRTPPSARSGRAAEEGRVRRSR